MTLGRLPVVHLFDPPSAWPADRRAVLLVPGEDATVLDFEMPARVRRNAARRITFHAVQDLVGEDMENIHLVRLPRPTGSVQNRAQSIVTSRVRMEGWFDEAKRAGVRLAAILPDYLALPWDPGTWTVSVETGRLSVRFDRLNGFAAEPELAALILERRLKDAPIRPQRVRLLGGQGATTEPLAALLSRLGEAGIQVDREVRSAGTARFQHGEFDANLVTGAFGESLGVVQGVIRWRLPIGLAAAALLLWTLDTGLTLREQGEEIQRLNRRIEKLFRTEFVPHGPVMDIRVQAARSLETLRAETVSARQAGGFLALVAASGKILAESSRQVSRLSYQDGVLTADVTLADFRVLQTLSAKLAQARLDVKVRSSTASGEEGVLATLALQSSESRDG